MGTLFKRGRNWVFEFFDASGRRQTVYTRTSDRRAADMIGREQETKAALVRAGLARPEEERFAEENRRELEAHFDAYLEFCRQDGQADQHIETKRVHLHRFASKTGARRLSDLEPERVTRFLEMLKLEDYSARSRNAQRNAVLAFATWCVRVGRMPSHRLEIVPKAEERSDRRRVRRAFTADELEALLRVARERDAALNGRWRGHRDARYPAYLCAALTGLRRGELGKITWGDIDLEAASVRVRVEVGKAKREDVLPLHSQVVEALQAMRPENVLPSARVFRSLPTARTMFEDMKRAKIALKDDAGRILDFHSLRVTLGTALARLGTAPQVAMKLLRHAKMETTLSSYTKLRLDDLSKAIDRLPSVGASPASRSEDLKATRTNSADAQQYPQQIRHDGLRNGASTCESASNTRSQIRHNPSPMRTCARGCEL